MRWLLAGLALVACKSGEQTAGTSSEARPSAKPAVPEATKPGMKWIAIPDLGIEVEAPQCAKVEPLLDKQYIIIPDDSACAIPLPGPLLSAIGLVGPPIEAFLNGQIKEVGLAPDQIVRKQETATGWILESNDGKYQQVTARIAVADRACGCMWTGEDADDNKRQIAWSICASARPKH